MAWILEGARDYGQGWVNAAGAEAPQTAATCRRSSTAPTTAPRASCSMRSGFPTTPVLRARLRPVAPYLKALCREWLQRGTLTTTMCSTSAPRLSSAPWRAEWPDAARRDHRLGVRRHRRRHRIPPPRVSRRSPVGAQRRDLGGVWRDNRYPGAACDVPSPFYSFSWAPWGGWPRRYAGQPDILDYLRAVAEREGVAARTQLRLRGGRRPNGPARLAGHARRWATDEVDLLVSAVGQLSNPVVPVLAGADTFGGPAFHTARWPDDLDLTRPACRRDRRGRDRRAGRARPRPRGGLRGPFPADPELHLAETGCRLPPLVSAHRRAHRAPVLPLASASCSRSSSIPAPPAARIGAAVTRAHLRLRVADPTLRRALTPDYPLGCRRILFSNDFYPALCRDNVEVVTGSIDRIEPGAVDHRGRSAPPGRCPRLRDRVRHAIIPPRHPDHRPRRRGSARTMGRRCTRAPRDLCSRVPESHALVRPEHQSRRQLDHRDARSRGAPHAARRRSHGRAQVRARSRRSRMPSRGGTTKSRAQLATSAWTSCDSWYRHPETGRITSNWPGGTNSYVARVRDLTADEFDFA